MTIFENVKASVAPKDVAERYGVKLSHNNMICCPFHNDRHPGMKLNDDYFYCFGCAAHGDVIDFTARLFDISLPKVFFTDEKFRDLSAESKVLYGILLDRMSLSQKNGWADGEAWVK